MTEIKFWWDTYVGTAEGDHGVFTDSDGRVYVGQIAGGSARVGVATWTGGTTFFAECDADGEPHGRWLTCTGNGDTEYCRYEHSSVKEQAVLRADGSCAYNGKPCRADYAPFVALQAMVVPIKARPPLVPPTAASLYAALFRPLCLPVGPIGHWFATRRSWRRPTPTRCALAASAISSLHSPCNAHGSCQTNAPRVQPGRRTGRRGALRMRHKPHA